MQVLDETIKRACVVILTALPIVAALKTGNLLYLIGLTASVINSAFIYSKAP